MFLKAKKYRMKLAILLLLLMVSMVKIGMENSSFNVGGVSFISVAEAQNFDKLVIPKPSTLPGPTDSAQNKNYLRDTLIVAISRTMIAIVGGLALLFFIIGGVRFLASFGDENAITAGKKMLIWSVVGFLIAVFSYAIISIIGNIQITPPQSVTTTQSTKP